MSWIQRIQSRIGEDHAEQEFCPCSGGVLLVCEGAIIFHFVDLSSTTVLKDHHKALSLASPLQNRCYFLQCAFILLLKNNYPYPFFFWVASCVQLLPTYPYILYSSSSAVNLCKKIWWGIRPPNIILIYLYLCVMPQINIAFRGCSHMRVILPSNFICSHHPLVCFLPLVHPSCFPGYANSRKFCFLSSFVYSFFYDHPAPLTLGFPSVQLALNPGFVFGWIVSSLPFLTPMVFSSSPTPQASPRDSSAVASLTLAPSPPLPWSSSLMIFSASKPGLSTSQLAHGF